MCSHVLKYNGKGPGTPEGILLLGTRLTSGGASFPGSIDKNFGIPPSRIGVHVQPFINSIQLLDGGSGGGGSFNPTAGTQDSPLFFKTTSVCLKEGYKCTVPVPFEEEKAEPQTIYEAARMAAVISLKQLFGRAYNQTTDEINLEECESTHVLSMALPKDGENPRDWAKQCSESKDFRKLFNKFGPRQIETLLRFAYSEDKEASIADNYLCSSNSSDEKRKNKFNKLKTTLKECQTSMSEGAKKNLNEFLSSKKKAEFIVTDEDGKSYCAEKDLKGNIHVYSTGKIGEFYLTKCPEEIHVYEKPTILLFGSNPKLFRDPASDPTSELLGLRNDQFRTDLDVKTELASPRKIDLVNYAASLELKTVLDKNNIPNYVIILAQDLVQTGNIEQIKLYRKEFMELKHIPKEYEELNERYGYGGLPLRVREKKGLKKYTEANRQSFYLGPKDENAILVGLESNHRSPARKGIESRVEELETSGKDGVLNVSRNWFFSMSNAKDEYSFTYSRTRDSPVIEIPVAVRRGKHLIPMCAFMAPNFLEEMGELGFSHIISIQDEAESKLMSQAIFLYKKVLDKSSPGTFVVTTVDDGTCKTISSATNDGAFFLSHGLMTFNVAKELKRKYEPKRNPTSE